MARHYKYITFSDRREIAALYQANARPADIAERLGVTTATIYRELKRGEIVGEGGGLTTRLSPSRGYRQISGGGAGPPRTACKEVSMVTQFEKITESPDVLAAFLASQPVIDGPWDTEFHKRFCDYCPAKDCDDCWCKEFRDNPRWWLSLTDTQEPSEETKRAARKLAALVDQYSAAEAGEMLEISMKALEILKEEKISGYGWATAISIAQAIGIHERG